MKHTFFKLENEAGAIMVIGIVRANDTYLYETAGEFKTNSTPCHFTPYGSISICDNEFFDLLRRQKAAKKAYLEKKATAERRRHKMRFFAANDGKGNINALIWQSGKGTTLYNMLDDFKAESMKATLNISTDLEISENEFFDLMSLRNVQNKVRKTKVSVEILAGQLADNKSNEKEDYLAKVIRLNLAIEDYTIAIKLLNNKQ